MTDYIGKINSYPIGGKNFDGDVVWFTTDQEGLIHNANYEHNLLFDTTTIAATSGTATYSVANIIPDDGYDYELCVSVYCKTPNSSGKTQVLNLKPGSEAGYLLYVGYRTARTNQQYAEMHTEWLPIEASDKNISFANYGSGVVTYNCQIHGYRRIGTNGKTSSNILADINTGVKENYYAWTSDSITGGTVLTKSAEPKVGDKCYFRGDTDPNNIFEFSTITAVGSNYTSISVVNGYFTCNRDSSKDIQVPVTKLGGKNFDGQWTLSYKSLSANVTYTKNSVTTYSLADYLPDDGYDYMVSFGGWGATLTSTSITSLRLLSGTQTYDKAFPYGCRMMATEYHSTSYYVCSGNLMIPIFANDRNVTIAQTENYNTGDCGLYALAYRRIGTNE
jgi:hypothetical protein